MELTDFQERYLNALVDSAGVIVVGRLYGMPVIMTPEGRQLAIPPRKVAGKKLTLRVSRLDPTERRRCLLRQRAVFKPAPRAM